MSDADQTGATNPVVLVIGTTGQVGKLIVDEFMQRAAASRGDVAQDVEIPASLQEIVDRMTVATLLKYAGSAMTPDDVVALNGALNAIAK